MIRGKLERHVEQPVVKWARARGWRAKKMNGLGDRGWPDRLFVGPSVMAFVEFKRKGEELTLKQCAVIDELREFGHDVEWFDDSDEAIAWLSKLEKEHANRKTSEIKRRSGGRHSKSIATKLPSK